MKNYLLALFYFTVSAVLTWLFVIFCPMYISEDQMVLSTLIAGGKWGIQIGSGLLFLKEKAPLFLRKTGEVCLTGSLLLIRLLSRLFSKFQIVRSFSFYLLSSQLQ